VFGGPDNEPDCRADELAKRVPIKGADIVAHFGAEPVSHGLAIDISDVEPFDRSDDAPDRKPDEQSDARAVIVAHRFPDA